MATEIYKTKTVTLLDGTEVELKPLKIKYLKRVMEVFEAALEKDADMLDVLIYCAKISMHQFIPEIKWTEQLIEDKFDKELLHDILEVGAGIKLKEEESSSEKGGEGQSWKDLDLAKLESEVFVLGIWKNYEELENSISMPELISVLSTRRELEHDEKKFLAALQGVDLDKESGRGQEEWERLKAKVFSGGSTEDPNDVLSLQGYNAQKVGFGIGMGLDYEDLR